MTASEQIEYAIRDSIRENRIVIIEERHRSAEWEVLETELLCEAEDHVEIVDAAEGIALRRDYWGTTEDGEEWRIYLDGFHFEVGEHVESDPAHAAPVEIR